MRLRVVDAVTRPSREVNEDGWVHAGDQVWVLDGASGLAGTSVTSGATDAAWLVERATRIITQHAAAHGGPDPVTTLAAVVHDIEAALPGWHDALAHELPSASLVAVALDGDELLTITLGDCRLLLRSPGGGTQVVDDASVLDDLDRGAIELLAAEQRRTGSDLSTARATIAPLLRSNRDLLNGPGGYRALAPGLDVADVVQRRIRVHPGTIGVLVSDGYFRLVDTFRALDADGLIDAVRTEGADTVLGRLREIEEDDPEGRRFPRLKRSDDATAVVIEVVSP